MSSSRRTYDTDKIIVREVTAYDPTNKPIPALRTLTAGGDGTTFWAIPSSLGGFPAYNRFVVNNTNVVADLSYNSLIINSTEGIGIDIDQKELTFFNKGFTKFDISGGNSLVGYSNQTVTPTVKFIGTDGIRLSSDPLTNTFYLQGITGAISSGIYGYAQLNVISNASTLTTQAIGNSNNTYLTATSPSTVLNVIGVGDILLATNTTSNAYFISISSFTSEGYLALSSLAYNAYASTLSTVSTLFYDIPMTGNATSSLLNLTSNVSTGIQQQFIYDQQNVMLNYTPIGKYNALSNIVVIGFPSTTVGLGSSQYVSTASLISTVVGLGTANYVSTASLVSTVDSIFRVGINDIIVSTVTGLGSATYLSTASLVSCVRGLGLVGYVSSASLVSSVVGLGSAGYVSSASLVSSVVGLGAAGYVSTASLVSSVVGLGAAGYVSTASLASTVAGLGSAAYVSSASLVSCVRGLGLVGYVSSTSLASTVAGLGTATYISTLSLVSTVTGLSNYINSFIDPAELTSTVIGLATESFVSTSGVTSSITGLGSAGYLSTASLVSSVVGLGSAGYVSTTQLNSVMASTVAGLGSAAYVSTTQLNSAAASTVAGLGSAAYVSTASLVSSVAGLGSAGYVSTTSLTSTVVGLGSAGYTSTNYSKLEAIAIGSNAGLAQGALTVAIGSSAGKTGQGNFAVSVGGFSGQINQGVYSVALGSSAGQSIQGSNCLALGANAGSTTQRDYAIAVGNNAGLNNQQTYGIAIGVNSGNYYQGEYSIGIGHFAASSIQGSNSIAIGKSAGQMNQSTNSIAIGWLAGQATTCTSSIILNASGSALNTVTPGLFVNPVRFIGNASNVMSYNPETSEISYNDNLTVSSVNTSGLTTSSIGVGCNSPSYTLDVNGQVNVLANYTNLTVAVGDSTEGNFLYSYDGISWNQASSGTLFNTGTYQGFVAWNGRWWLGGGDGSFAGGLQYSTDGSNWQDTDPGMLGYVFHCATPIGNNWIIGGSGTGDGNTMWSMDDSYILNPIGAILPYECHGIAWNGQYAVAVGDTTDDLGGIRWSTDGFTWNNITSGGFPSPRIGYAVAWNGFMWVAVGSGAAVGTIYSTDGQNWSTGIGGLSIGYDVAWNGIMWVTVGQGNFGIRYSYNGMTWSNVLSGGFSVGRSVTWNGTLWIATGTSSGGLEGAVQYSSDGLNWSNSEGTTFSSGVAYGVGYNKPFIADINTSTMSLYFNNHQPTFTDDKHKIVAYEPLLNLDDTVFINKDTHTVGIKNTNAQYTLDVNGTINATDTIRAFGGVLSNGTFLTSDSNVKENISSADLLLCYANTKNLPLHRFNFISSFSGKKIDKGQIGFIAQEVSTIFPKSLVQMYEDSVSASVYHMNYDQIFLSHYGATQLLMSTVEGQQAQINEMSNLLARVAAHVFNQ